MRIVLLGPPGAGKGSLASPLKRDVGLLHLSTGDILRSEMKNNTPLGIEAKKFVDEGKLVPDELVIRLIESEMKNHPESSDSFMLDGFPRTVAQAEELDRFLESNQMPLDFAFYMDAELELIIFRLTGRRVCRECGMVYHVKNHPPQKEGVCDTCGGELYQRADDNEETIRNRMDVYLKNTLPIVDYYEKKGILRRIDGRADSEELKDLCVKIANENA